MWQIYKKILSQGEGLTLFIGFLTFLERLQAQDFSTDSTPIDIGLAQFPQPFPHHGEVISIALRVSVYHLAGLIPGHLHQLAIRGDIGYFQVKSHTTLLRSLQVTRPPEFQVCLGNAKPSLVSHMISMRLRVISASLRLVTNTQ